MFAGGVKKGSDLPILSSCQKPLTVRIRAQPLRTLAVARAKVVDLFMCGGSVAAYFDSSETACVGHEPRVNFRVGEGWINGVASELCMSETPPVTQDRETGSPAKRPVRSGAETVGRAMPPKRERSAWMAWLTLLLCLLAIAAGVLSGIATRGVMVGRESAAVGGLAETWSHQRALEDGEGWEPLAWTPVEGGELRFGDPPGALWLQMLAMWDLRGGEVDRDTMRLRGRLVSAAMLLLAVAGTFWATHAIGGVLPATLAALAAGSMPLWLAWGRTSDPALVTAGWTMLAVGAGMWATRPLRPPPSVPRQVLGWALCGVLLGAAVLSGGLRALPPAVVPLVIVLVIAPHRVGHLLGLLTALATMALMLTPWALHVHEHDAGAWYTWWQALSPTQWDRPVGYGKLMLERLGWLALLLSPWSLWVGAGLLQTFSTSTSGARFRMLIGWAWFVLIAAMLLASPGQRLVQPLLLAVSAAAVVVGQVFRQFSDLASGGRIPRLWRWLRWPHFGALALLTLALPGAAIFQRTLVSAAVLDSPWVAPMAWQYWAAGALTGGMLLGWSIKTLVRHEPARCAILWGVWGIVMTAFFAGPVARGPLLHDMSRPAASAAGLREPINASRSPAALRPASTRSRSAAWEAGTELRR